MTRIFILLCTLSSVLLPGFVFQSIAQPYPSLFVVEARTGHESFSKPYRLISAEAAVSAHWDTLPQIRFWRQLIQLTEDSALISLASNRQIAGKISTSEWESMSGNQQRQFLNQFRQERGLGRRALYVTPGKKAYYQLEAALPDIHRSIRIFEAEGVEGWYAQAILLVESPGASRTSPVGASGPFQLMPYVARSNGLQVNKERDEREDLEKSAVATARFLQHTCLPETRRLLRSRRIRYQESALWFRLLVLHVYHAGTQNVSEALDKVRSRRGGMSLIRRMWRTRTAGFQNASQNYSQVALATWLELQELAYRNYEIACGP